MDAVDERDTIFVLDAADDSVIWAESYYAFRIDGVFSAVQKHFAKEK